MMQSGNVIVAPDIASVAATCEVVCASLPSEEAGEKVGDDSTTTTCTTTEVDDDDDGPSFACYFPSSHISALTWLTTTTATTTTTTIGLLRPRGFGISIRVQGEDGI